MKEELEIGDIIEVCNIRIKCREQKDGTCHGCYWFVDEYHECTDCYNSCGLCSSTLRSDHKDVIFVKVGKVQNA
jgi:hypothetical protein